MIRPPGGWHSATFEAFSTRLIAVLGDKAAKKFDALGLDTVGDLIHHLPRRHYSGTELSDLSLLRPDEEVAVMAEVVDSETFNMPGDPRRSRTAQKPRLQVTITDNRGLMTLTFFGKPHLIGYWQGQLTKGVRGIFAGKVREFNHELQLSHPDFAILDDNNNVVGGSEPSRAMAEVTQRHGLVGLYPATRGMPTWLIADCVDMALTYLRAFEDPLPDWVREQAGLVDLRTAIRSVHQPEDRAEVETGLDRLRFDEAFGIQLTMAKRRAAAAAQGAIPRPRKSGGLLDAFDARLPFDLTNGQVEVAEEIFADLAKPHPMQRLLQGEVGSGKTIVALRAMLSVIDAGGQAALLAPTEVLASQHLATITKMLGELGEAGMLSEVEHSTQVVLLTGSMSAAQKREAMLKAASGEAGIVIGTHALLGENVQFAELGLVVVDEQHRFGVEQRAALNAKAAAHPHVLVMTATPIPRSIAITVFGDLETSTLREIPAGRADVQTVLVDARQNPRWVTRAWERIVEEVAQGRQAYVVCARITETGKSAPAGEYLEDPDAPVPAVPLVTLFEELTTGPFQSIQVEMLHGQLPGEEKDAVMKRFAAGETKVVIATTVIEVGVDVPNASVMVVCDADRFGISQLHQLRGRIGRGDHPGICLLLTKSDAIESRERLAAVARTRDGFELAQIDLAQRREGNVLGAQQSGQSQSLRLLNVLDDEDLILQARNLAIRCIESDPDLTHPGLADIVASLELDAAELAAKADKKNAIDTTKLSPAELRAAKRWGLL